MPAACTPITGDTGPGSGGASTGEVRVRLQVQPGSIVRDAALSAFYGRTNDATPRLLAARSVSVTHGRPVRWTSGDPAVVFVDAAGRLVAMAPGVTSLTARSLTASTTTTVGVFHDVATIVLGLRDTLRIGDTVTIRIDVRDRFGAPSGDVPVQWDTDAPSVATAEVGVHETTGITRSQAAPPSRSPAESQLMIWTDCSNCGAITLTLPSGTHTVSAHDASGTWDASPVQLAAGPGCNLFEIHQEPVAAERPHRSPGTRCGRSA